MTDTDPHAALQMQAVRQPNGENQLRKISWL
jgi:hypothetical protein